jgi:hypothetical protein
MHPKIARPDELHAYNVRSNRALRWNAWVGLGGRGSRGLDPKSARSKSFWLKASGSPASTWCRVPVSRCRRATRHPWTFGCSSALPGCGVITPSWRQVAQSNGFSARSTVCTEHSGRWATAVLSPYTTTTTRAVRLSQGEPFVVGRETRRRHWRQNRRWDIPALRFVPPAVCCWSIASQRSLSLINGPGNCPQANVFDSRLREQVDLEVGAHVEAADGGRKLDGDPEGIQAVGPPSRRSQQQSADAWSLIGKLARLHD